MAEAAHGGGLVLVMELMELGSLADLLENRMFRCDADFALQALRDVTQGMRFLHEDCQPVSSRLLGTSRRQAGPGSGLTGPPALRSSTTTTTAPQRPVGPPHKWQ